MGGAPAAVVYGLFSAFAWGAGDFIGGFASRRIKPSAVIFVSQFAGLVTLVAVALALGEAIPERRDLLLGAASGLVGVAGLAALYRGLAEHKMGTIAPLSALMTALLPIIAGTALEGLPSPAQIGGMLAAVPAIYLVSREDESVGTLTHLPWSVLRYPLLAGLGFGLFFILLDQVTDGAVFWPVVAARAASVPAVGLWWWLSRRRGRASSGSGAENPRLGGLLPIVLLGGLFDAGGNVFFALATQAGRLDIASVLASLFPAGTVFLAWLVLKERLSRTQRTGVLAALAAVLLFSLP